MLIVQARAVSKAYGLRQVLRGVDLTVARGERVVVVGSNGSGKSTLLLVLAGVLRADEGDVRVEGPIGFAPEKPDLPDHLVVAEWLDLVASLKGLRARPVSPFGVDGLAGSKLGALSLGQRQRVSLAAACLGSPSILLLDEPTNGIDDGSRAELEARLSGASALVATHDRAFAERVGTRVVAMQEGRVTSD
jgi:ABC-type multidrug transport system ATPase subunit